MQPPGRIQQDYVVTALFGVLYTVCRNTDSVLDAILFIDRNAELLAQRAQLVNSRRALKVIGHQKRFFVILVTHVPGQLAGGRRFTRPLKTGQHHNRRPGLT